MMTTLRPNVLRELRRLWGAGLVAALVLTLAPAQAGAISSDITVTRSTDTAGAHPNLTVHIGDGSSTGGQVEDLVTHLPPGALVNAQAVPRCSNEELMTATPAFANSTTAAIASSCPADTLVGSVEIVATMGPAAATAIGNVYNVEPLGSEVVRLGIVSRVFEGGKLIYAPTPPTPMTASLRSTDYGADSFSLDMPKMVSLDDTGNFPTEEEMDKDITVKSIDFLLCGLAPVAPVPRDSGVRSCTDPVLPGGQKPFVTNPTSCAAATTSVDVFSWASPNSYPGTPDASATSSPFTPTDCGSVPFAPTIDVERQDPATGYQKEQAGAPVGYTVAVEYPYDEDAAIYQSHLKRAEVTLPAGVALNPGASVGLEACTDAQFGFVPGNYSSSPLNSGFDANAPNCPADSNIGTAKVWTPLVDADPTTTPLDPLTGEVYFAQPTQADPWRLFVNVEGGGVRVKLRSTVTPDPQTGQLKTVFDDNPQTPFTRFELALRGGDRAILRNPTSCGNYTASAALTGWSGAAANPTDSFPVNSGCPPATQPFGPTFGVSSNTAQAAAGVNSTYTIERPDGHQLLSRLHLSHPAGLLGSLAAAPLCPLAQAQAGTCDQASEVGSIKVLVDTGGSLLTLPGQLYLAAPLVAGDAASLAVVVPVKVGPIDLGRVVVMNNVRLRPTDQGIEVISGPIPTIFAGVPIAVRKVEIAINRNGFLRNPTGCNQRPYGITFTSNLGASAPVSVPFNATGCEALPFQPKLRLIAGAEGQTKERTHPPLRAIVTQTEGEANLAKSVVVLPDILRPNTVQFNKPGALCQDAQLAARACPATSQVGTASATTPLLPAPLSGPVYIVQQAGNPLPKLAVLLQGQIEILLNAQSALQGIRTATTFDAIPDTPISSFDLRLNGGENGILNAWSDLCTASPTPTGNSTFTGQNGKTYSATPKLEVEGCTNSTPGIKIMTKSVRATKRSVAKVRLRCLAESQCKGRVTLQTRGKVRVSAKRKRSKRKKLTLGRRSFTIAAGKTRTVKVKLRKRARRALKRAKKGRLKARTTVTPSKSSSSSASFKTTKRNLTLKKPKRKRSRKR